MKHLLAFPKEVEDAALNKDPHKITNYVHELATLVHSFYSECRKISGVSYADAVTRAVPKTIDGIPVRIISLDDLIANKKASGRAKDLADVEVLEGCRK